MNANRSIKIAIFGLSLRALNELKEQVRQIIPIEISIQWTNISEPDLNALLINEHFFESASIQSLITTNRPQYLRLVTTPSAHSKIEDDILYLPVVDTQPLRTWFIDHVILPVATHTNKNDISSSSDTIRPSANQSNMTSPSATSISGQSLDTETIAVKLKLFQDLLDPRHGKIRIFDQQGQLAIVDMRNEIATLDPTREQPTSNLSLNFTYATMNDTVKLRGAATQQIYVWLWNVIWQSPDFGTLAPEKGFYKLKFWPQPNKMPERRDILRMSACFAQGASIAFVAQHLDIPLNKVRQFVAACLVTGYIESISENKVGFTAQKIKTDTEASGGDSGTVRKFFGGLRRRLGL